MMTKSIYTKIFGNRKPVIAMIHLQALPGTPANRYNINDIVEMARQEARLLRALGVHALLIENMHDTPYLRRKVGPEITATATAAALAVKAEAPDLPCGIQLLAGANQEALAVALASGFDFIRAEGFVFGHLADEGWMNSDAGELLRYRKNIGAEEIAIFTDIKKKHSAHAMSIDVSLAETAEAAQFFHSDGVIITGNATGKAAQLEDIKAVHQMVPELPRLIGSGITDQNIAAYYPFADGFIVGSFIKENGHWQDAISEERVSRLLIAHEKSERQIS